MTIERAGGGLIVVLFCVVVAACSSGSSGSAVVVRVVGQVTSAEGGAPVAGAEVRLVNGGDDCIRTLESVSPVVSGSRGGGSSLASLVPIPPRPLATRRISCYAVDSDQTDGDGRFALSYQTSAGGEGCTGLTLNVTADGFIGRYTSAGAVACTRTEQVRDFVLTPGTVPFSLIGPLDGATIPQNRPSSGCTEHPTRGFGYQIAFDWTDATLPGPDGYRIQLLNPGLVPVIDEVVFVSQFLHARCEYVPDDQLSSWQWRVRYERGGQVSQWTPDQFIGFEPCRISEGVACSG